MRSLVLGLVGVAALLSSVGLAAVGVAPAERVFTLTAVALACENEDGVCLAFDGAIPGPALDVRLGDHVTLTLENRIAETIAALDAPQALKDRLSEASVSFHVHGTSVSADMDGVAAHPGTKLVESVAKPNGSFTYRFRAAFQGAWHYHDHVLGADGMEGTQRGLYGGLVIRGGGEATPAALLDLHLHDAGPNSGRGLEATVPAGKPFEILVAGLGDNVWTVTLEDPSGDLVGKFDIGPGVSERFRVASAKAGVYTWTATWGPDSFEGEVTAA